MMAWMHLGPYMLASFMASMVEFIEAMTVVLAVGTVRGWRSSLFGTAAALVTLLLLVAVLGQSISRIPLPIVQIVIGTLLLMFGFRWLRKAVLRSAGVIARRDEATTYARKTEALRKREGAPAHSAWDGVAFATAFKIVMLEGVEVVFIVIAIGASGGMIVPASIGAGAALVLVVLLGLSLHRPLASIPENALKTGVGILLSAFGTFWIGEGVHLEWPGEDWAVLALVIGYFVATRMLVWICHASAKPTGRPSRKNNGNAPRGIAATLIHKLIRLFVDDARLAIGIIAWVALAWACARSILLTPATAGSIFFAGFVLLLAYSATHAPRN